MISANGYLNMFYLKGSSCVRLNEKKPTFFDKKEIDNYGKKRSEITHLYLSDENLEGVLDLSDFVNLEELYCWDNELTQINLPQNNNLKILDCRTNKLTNLNLANCLSLEELSCNDNKLTQLILPQSDKLKKIYCFDNKLTSLDLTNCFNLKGLYCQNNQLLELILPTDNQLEGISVVNNYLTSFDYDKLNSQTLTELSLSNNNLEKTDISVFSQLVNLTNLKIGNENRWVVDDKGVNEFFGSLISLKNLTKLKALNILNTKINSGLEYLTLLEKLKLQSCFYSKGTPIEKILNLHEGIFDKWKEANPQLIKNVELIVELEQIKEKLCKEIISLKIEDENKKKGGNIWWTRNKDVDQALLNPKSCFLPWINERISNLRIENEQYYQNIEINTNH